MNEQTIKERCEKAADFLAKKRKELETLQSEYMRIAQAHVSPIDLLDIKERLIDFAIGMSSPYTLTKDLYLKAQMERDNAHTLAFIKERGVINETTGKPTSVESAKDKAKLKIAEEYMTEYLADINHITARKLISDAQLLIDAAIQRVSVVKGEQFNSRQPNTI